MYSVTFTLRIMKRADRISLTDSVTNKYSSIILIYDYLKMSYFSAMQLIFYHFPFTSQHIQSVFRNSRENSKVTKAHSTDPTCQSIILSVMLVNKCEHVQKETSIFERIYSTYVYKELSLMISASTLFLSTDKKKQKYVTRELQLI